MSRLASATRPVAISTIASSCRAGAHADILAVIAWSAFGRAPIVQIEEQRLRRRDHRFTLAGVDRERAPCGKLALGYMVAL